MSYIYAKNNPAYAPSPIAGYGRQLNDKSSLFKKGGRGALMGPGWPAGKDCFQAKDFHLDAAKLRCALCGKWLILGKCSKSLSANISENLRPH